MGWRPLPREYDQFMWADEKRVEGSGPPKPGGGYTSPSLTRVCLNGLPGRGGVGPASGGRTHRLPSTPIGPFVESGVGVGQTCCGAAVQFYVYHLTKALVSV